jgi:hypothetical protein
MSRRITRTAQGVFAALVAAGLTFGAGSVLASPASAAAACPYNPSIGQIGASCATHTYCTQVCTNFYGQYSPSRCSSGCCVCAY